MIDLRLGVRRDLKAAGAFNNKRIERIRQHRPVTIAADKVLTYDHVIHKIKRGYLTSNKC